MTRMLYNRTIHYKRTVAALESKVVGIADGYWKGPLSPYA